MNVSITPNLEGMVNEKVQSGLYVSPSEVVNASLRLAELRREVQIGLDQLERGEGIAYESPEALFSAIKTKPAASF